MCLAAGEAQGADGSGAGGDEPFRGGAAVVEGVPPGDGEFAGVADGNVEMLFVDADFRGQGWQKQASAAPYV